MEPMRLLLLVIPAIAFSQTPSPAPYPPPGRMVDLGGYRVHLDCEGQGSPTVLIVGGGFSFDWSLVQPRIAQTTRVCVYDASGTAWSERDPAMRESRTSEPPSGRTCPAWVNEVHQLVSSAHIPGPLVLVGLSAGAIVARLYATEFPNDTAGLVIVDHAFLPQPESHPPPPAQAGASGSNAVGASGSNAFDRPPALISMTPIVINHADESGFASLPEKARALDLWATSMNPDLPTPETAQQCMAAAEAASGRKAQPLGDVPLMVISTANETPGYSELQAHLLGLSRNSGQLIASASVHSIEISQPDVVIEGIQKVIFAARNRGRVNPSTR